MIKKQTLKKKLCNGAYPWKKCPNWANGYWAIALDLTDIYEPEPGIPVNMGTNI
jgi:hypothetical protein